MYNSLKLFALLLIASSTCWASPRVYERSCFDGSGSKCGYVRIATKKAGGTSARVKVRKQFELNYSGDTLSPAFEIKNKSASIEYSFDDESGKGGLSIDLINLDTGKRVERLVNARGTVDATTLYLNRVGVFYLKVAVKKPGRVCTSEDGIRTCEDMTVSYSIIYDAKGGAGSSDGGGYDFDFGF